MPPLPQDRDRRLGTAVDAAERARGAVAQAKAGLAQAHATSLRLREDAIHRRDTCERLRAETKVRITEGFNPQQAASRQREEGMADHQGLWHAEPHGILAAEIDGFRLVVQAPEAVGGLTRFLVLRQEGKEHAIVGSGSNETVQAAMGAAMKMAERILSRPLGGGA